MKAYFGGFDYVIDDVTVDGDTATATVTLTCKSFDDYMNAVTDVGNERQQRHRPRRRPSSKP